MFAYLKKTIYTLFLLGRRAIKVIQNPLFWTEESEWNANNT